VRLPMVNARPAAASSGLWAATPNRRRTQWSTG
jgi:hypothetical protein